MTEASPDYMDAEPTERTCVQIPLAIKRELIELADRHGLTFDAMLAETLKAGLGMPTRFGLPEEGDK